MKSLRISSSLSLPLDFVTQTQAILAMKRVGKSYTASVEAEELLKAGQQVVVIDMTGAWWGLRSNSAGDGPGFPITIFGGDHGDLPLEKTAGETLAEAIVSERFNAILDLSLLRKSEALTFLVSFLETLYRKNREAMHLFCDEADYYAPQKPYGEEIKTLGAMNDIVLRGGIKGIGCTLITQRPTRINKDVLTQCGILMCLRMSHPRDLEPIEEWVSEHSAGGFPAEMRKSLPSMPKGTAWIWAAGWPTEDGIFKQIKIRQRSTFNSGATPEIGKSLKGPKVMAKVDLAKLGQRIAATVEQVKSNDPVELRKRIKELEAKIALPVKVAAPVAPEVETLDREKMHEAQRGEIERLVEYKIRPTVDQLLSDCRNVVTKLRDTMQALEIHIGALSDKDLLKLDFISDACVRELDKAVVLSKPSTSSVPIPTSRTVRENPKAIVTGEGIELSGPEQRILNAIAWMESIGIDAPKQTAVAFLADYKYGAGSFNNPRGSLRVKGLIEYRGDSLVFTPAGRSLAVTPQDKLTAKELQAKVLDRLPNPEKKILTVLIESYPDAITHEEAARRSNYAFGSGSYNNPKGRLVSLQLATSPLRSGTIKAADLLFL